MADDCCNSFGGKVAIEIDGVRYSPTEADITIQPSNVEIEGHANQDGSAAYTAKPVLATADIKFRKPCGIRWNETMRKCSVNVTIDEVDNNRTHLFSRARITGRPSVNLKTGEVDGVKVEGPSYQEI